MSEIPHVQNPVKKYAEERGWLTRRVTYLARRGAPDLWCLKDGRWLIIEFKDKGKAPNPQQEREIKRLRDAGAEVHVIDNAEDGFELFD